MKLERGFLIYCLLYFKRITQPQSIKTSSFWDIITDTNRSFFISISFEDCQESGESKVEFVNKLY